MYTVYIYMYVFTYIYICFRMFLHAHMPSLIPHPDRCVEKVQVVDKKAMASTFRSEVASQSRLFMSHLVLNLLQLRFFLLQVLK